MTRVGVVGLGKMGSAIASNLLSRGYTVNVWNRTPGKAGDLIHNGATECATLRELVDGAEAVIVMLWGDDAAREVSLGEVIPAARAGQLVIETSTLSPAMYETLEVAARERNVAFLAAPVLGSVDVARTGALTVLAGGDAQTYQRARRLLEVLGNPVISTGSARASGYLKLSNNEILAVFAATMRELLGLCERAGVDRRIAIDLFTGTFSRAASGKKQQLLDGDTAPRFSLDALFKDLELASATAQTLAQSMPVLRAVLPAFEQSAASGIGERDYIAIALEPTTVSPVA